jgi:hypothetical protein
MYFDFFSLPAELRNMVYEYVVGKHRSGESPSFTRVCRDRTQLRYPRPGASAPSYRNQPIVLYSIGLLSTTKQLRDEALKILYSQNIFHVTLLQNMSEGRWSHSFDAERVTRMVIELKYYMG